MVEAVIVGNTCQCSRPRSGYCPFSLGVATRPSGSLFRSERTVVMIVFGGVFASLRSGAVIHPSPPPGAAFSSLDLRTMQLQKTQRTNNQLRVRRAQSLASQIPRHPGPQN